MKIRSGVEEKAGSDGQDHAADKQEGTIVRDEVHEGLHTLPFEVSAEGLPCLVASSRDSLFRDRGGVQRASIRLHLI